MQRSVNFAAIAIVTGVLLFPQNAGQPSGSQEHPPHPAPKVTITKIPPRAEDVSTIDGMVKAYYEVVSGPAGQRRQWDRDATLYIPNVRFILIHEDATGKTTAQSMTHQEFVDESESSLQGKAFYEREIHRITNRAGNAVHVFSTAERRSSLDGFVTGRSIDSLELYWGGSRWGIASVNIWDIESPKQKLPPEFLP